MHRIISTILPKQSNDQPTAVEFGLVFTSRRLLLGVRDMQWRDYRVLGAREQKQRSAPSGGREGVRARKYECYAIKYMSTAYVDWQPKSQTFVATGCSFSNSNRNRVI